MREIKRFFIRCIATIPILWWGLFSFAQGQSDTNSTFAFDHLVLFVSNPTLKDSLDELFTHAEKLTTTHSSQGTKGEYYLFYNTFLELLYLENADSAQANQKRFGCDYQLRWDQNADNVPVGFGLSMTPWKDDKHFHKYVSRDAPDGDYYLMGNDNGDLTQPLVYVSTPQHNYKSLKSLDELNTRPAEIRADLAKYITHPTGVKRLTKIICTVSENGSANGNIGLLDGSAVVQFVVGDKPSITLVFDNQKTRRKSYLIDGGFELILYY